MRLSNLPSSRRVEPDYAFSADGTSLLYRANPGSPSRFDLFRVTADGNAPAERLNGALPSGGDVEPGFVPLPNGRTLYRADQETDNLLELFVALED